MNNHQSYLPKLTIALLVMVTGPAVVSAEEHEFTTAQLETFEKQIRPLLAEHCLKCHGDIKPKGGLSLTSRASALHGGDTGPAIVPGSPGKSLLIDAIRYDPDTYQMPPEKKLPAEAIARLEDWVRDGAPWPVRPSDGTPAEKAIDVVQSRKGHWSLQPIMNPAPPSVAEKSWPRGPIDQFIKASLEKQGITPSCEVDRLTWLRRASFVLKGLPPTIAEQDEFLADTAPGADERVIDRLLSSPHFGERWARHWLDLVRFSETYGHEFDFAIPFAAKYRDYAIRAFNEDIPYDVFVAEHIAGDLQSSPRTDFASGENQSAQGPAFWWFGQAKHSPVDVTAEEYETIDNQLDVFGKTFLGMTIACARCHDHKFDAITTRDYYSLVGYLQSSRLDFADVRSQVAIARELNQLRERRDDVEKVLRQTVAARIDSFLDRLPELLQQRRDERPADIEPEWWKQWQGMLAGEAKRDTGHPLHAWAKCSDTPDESLAVKLNDLAAVMQQQREFDPESTNECEIIRDFRDWQPAMQAFDSKDVPAEDFSRVGLGFSESRPVDCWPRAAALQSSRLAPTLFGVARSPTRLISRRYLDICAARSAPDGEIQRPSIKGQIQVVVDGFHLIQQPLHGHLSVVIPFDKPLTWFRIDLENYQGLRAYLEVDDFSDGSIYVDEIRWTNGPPPANRPLADATAIATFKDASRTSTALRIQDWLRREVNVFRELASEVSDETRAVVNFLIYVDRWGPMRIDRNDGQVAPLVSRYWSKCADIGQPEMALSMCDGTAWDCSVLPRGNHKKVGEKVPRRFLEVFGSAAQVSQGSGRRDLSQRLTDRANPLVSRVIVNRLWKHAFGTGLVTTPDDFGAMGTLPSHPELLDFLAQDFVAGGWSIKRSLRSIVLSATFRQESNLREAAIEQLDPVNRLYHRQNLRRLEAEAIWDSLLVISGELDENLSPESVPVHLTAFMDGRGRPGKSGPLDGARRRSLYVSVRRNFLTPMLLAFDFPTPATTVGNRATSNVPSQGLAMMNNPFIQSQVSAWAKRSATADTDYAKTVRLGYRKSICREPNPEELRLGIAFLKSDRESPPLQNLWLLEDYYHALVNLKEFVYVP